MRSLIRQALHAVLPPVLAELRGWTPALRAAAVRQLRALVVLAEAAAVPHLPQLLPALAAAAGAAHCLMHATAASDQEEGVLVRLRCGLCCGVLSAGAATCQAQTQLTC